MKYKDIQDKSVNELRKMLQDAQVSLGRLKFELANRALKDVSAIGKARKEVANINTAITQSTTKSA